MNRHHVIRADFDDSLDGEPLYWSNVDGYVALSTADVYSEREKIDNPDLPLESRGWVTLGKAVEELAEYVKANEELLSAKIKLTLATLTPEPLVKVVGERFCRLGELTIPEGADEVRFAIEDLYNGPEIVVGYYCDDKPLGATS